MRLQPSRALWFSSELKRCVSSFRVHLNAHTIAGSIKNTPNKNIKIISLQDIWKTDNASRAVKQLSDSCGKMIGLLRIGSSFSLITSCSYSLYNMQARTVKKVFTPFASVPFWNVCCTIYGNQLCSHWISSVKQGQILALLLLAVSICLFR